MQKPTALNPVTTPLNSVVLIEASAGTGKTYTIASLYLRLLLQAGENHFSQPLSVEQILVVTFTEAATQELKERIRSRIHLAKKQLLVYREKQDKSIFENSDNIILAELVESISDINEAIHRLHIAEQNMDLAAIYTIHGFCRRVLMKYAFHSGISFNLDLVKDETELLQQFCREFWREFFYPQPLLMTQFLKEKFKSPDEVLKKIKKYVAGEPLNVALDNKLFHQSLPDFLQAFLHSDLMKFIALKEKWQQSAVEIRQILLNEINKPSKEKRVKGTSFKSNTVPNWLDQIDHWAGNSLDLTLPKCLTQYFSQRNLIEQYTPEGKMPLVHPCFEYVDEIGNTDFLLAEKIILHHYIQWVRQKLIDYKTTHTEKSFYDLLRLADDALKSAQGEDLAALIRHQYPFAMIDEFQDTDVMQYRIFSKLYAQTSDTGFIMIGDPKQAIYKFRGADINTYLQAASEAKVRFTLDKNFRSEGRLIKMVNQMFGFTPNPPFLYDEISFLPVGAGRPNMAEFQLNGTLQAPLKAYICEDKNLIAEICADSIYRLLSEKAGFVDKDFQPLLAKNIAVLVRNRYEADEIKQALQKRNIASVYLSDQSSVFESAIAPSLIEILKACLQPQSEKNVLAALSSLALGLNATQLIQIKQGEKQLESWLEVFEDCHKAWKFKGVLPMLHQLLHRKNEGYSHSMAERLMHFANGERLLTDFLHLAELLQQASVNQETEAALIVWLEKQLQKQDFNAEEQHIRLESEQDLVKIVTIHKSKGLEYDVVWLPFISKSTKKIGNNQITTYYHAENKQIQWDIQSQQVDLVQKEQFAEEMRLLYVALTRAKYHISLILPTEFKASGREMESWNSLLYAMTEGEIGTDIALKKPYCSVELLQKLQQKVGEHNIEIIQSVPISKDKYITHYDNVTYFAHRFNGNIEKNWHIASFTGLLNSHLRHTELGKSAVEKNAVLLGGNDENHSEVNIEQNTMSWQDYPEHFSPVDFPHGMNVGVILHKFFEKQPFNQPIKGELIEKIIRRLQLDEQWKIPLNQWIENILTTKLNSEGITLKQIYNHQLLKELQFYLKVKPDFSVKKFNDILQKDAYFKESSFSFEQLQGMLQGFIDLVFYHQGKYYLADYKSNLLGNNIDDYAADKLPQVMKSQYYDLQYLLYTVALDRYLQLRHKEYNYTQHFGGVFYCFLRGMNGKTIGQGVYFHQPDSGLIQALGELFYA
ncbi:MAG: exodeoxyribonuclease V subunit beta [Lonepinella koalarum]|nr:exodeoxyribonuclease V subunit beta [Lonepinella koalarum]